jgi:hypothetical protein
MIPKKENEYERHLMSCGFKIGFIFISHKEIRMSEIIFFSQTRNVRMRKEDVT